MDQEIKTVVVSAETMRHEDYRPGTVAGALASVLAPMEDGGIVKIAECVDPFGQLVSIKKIRDKLVYITQNHKDPRLEGFRFMTSTNANSLLVKKVKQGE